MGPPPKRVQNSLKDRHCSGTSIIGGTPPRLAHIVCRQSGLHKRVVSYYNHAIAHVFLLPVIRIARVTGPESFWRLVGS